MAENAASLDQPTQPQSPEGARARVLWRRMAFVSATFSFVLGLALLLGYVSGRAQDPLKSPTLRQLKQKLQAAPADEQIKTQIRVLDLQLRQAYFRQSSRAKTGAYLLLGSLVVFLVSMAQAARHRPRLPVLLAKNEDAERFARAANAARWSVAASGLTMGALLLILSICFHPQEPSGAAEVQKDSLEGTKAVASSNGPTLEQFLQNWPRFRGPEGNGFSRLTNSPIHWDAKTGEGIAWKTPSPAIGYGSPIIWGNRLFLSGGDASKREVFCFDTTSGKLLWRQPISVPSANPGQKPEIPDSTGYAAATMATDGQRVYAFFGNGDLAALTMEGKPVWAKSFGILKNPYGHATSVITWRDKLILQLDQGEPEEGKSKLYSLDGRNGKVLWEQARKVGSSWATPVVFETGGKGQVITLAVPWVIAYSLDNGTELWRVEGLNGEITPSPIFAGGLVFAASPSEKLMAIRPDGHGDVTKTHIAWSAEDNVPDVTSPAANDQFLFMLTTSGLLTCLDIKDGKKQWEHDFEMECHTSPTIAADHVYIFGQKGAAFVVEAARQYKEIFHTDLPDGFHASPAFAPDGIFLRGVTNIWCVGPGNHPGDAGSK